MKYLLITLLLPILIGGALLGCSRQKKETDSYQKKNFDSLMFVVEKNSDSLDTYKALLLDSAFTEIFKHSSSYFQDAVKSLKTGKVTNKRALIYLFAMQNLDLNHYINLAQLYTRFYDNNEITDYTVEHLIGGFLDKHILAQNYDDPAVVSVLNTFHNSRRASKELKAFVESALAGKLK